ncbi:AP-1 complex subunit beta-1 isoform X1 [Cydia pomonella]|nr:AP-1 complex subunit beta-1 isoform X1 [Cydia pomonella]
MKLMEMVSEDTELVSTLSRKLAPPLVTLLSAEPEVQYVALRNINLVVQKRPDILKHEMKVFFVKYNDPIYVKLEKLDIMIRLASQANIAQVLGELKEYATEVDVDFVRKAVRAIGRCAIKVEPSAERCVSTLLELIQTKVNYVVQEAVVVIKDIFRKYPNKYESIISTLCENLDTLDEPEARASMVWIVGEYAERIDNADELLDSFLEGFHDENAQVQLQLLTAVVKLFLKRPADTQELVQHVLSLATQDSDNPDLRDRGFIYWRLLSTDPAAAKEVVLADKPLISEETDLLEPTLLDELICHISSLASVYHKPPTAFVEGRGAGVRKSLPARGASEPSEAHAPQATVIPNQESLIGDLLSMDIGAPPAPPAAPASNLDLLAGGLDVLLGGGPEPAAGGSSGLLGDIFGAAAPACYVPPKTCWLPADKGKGLEIWGTFSRQGGQPRLEMTFTNKAMQAMSGFAIQLNKNSFGVFPAGSLSVGALAAGASAEAPLPLATTGPVQRMEPLNNLQVLSHSPGSCRWARWRPAPARRRRSPSPPPGPCSAWSRSTTCRYCPTALAAVGGRAGGRRQRGGAAPPRHHRARAAHGAAQQPAGTVPQPWQLSVGALAAGASAEAPLPLATTGPVQRMEPLNNLQVLSHSPGSCRWARWRPAPARRRRSPSPPPGPCSAWSRSTTCRYCPTALAAVGGRAGGRRQRGGAAPPRHHRARAAHGAAQQPAGTVPQPWQLSVGALAAGASAEAPLPLATTGPVQRMEPLNNLQVLSHSPGSCRWARWRPAPARRRRSPSPPPGPCSAWSRSTTCRYCPTALAAVGGRAGGRRQRGGAAPPRHHRARAAHGAAQQPAGTVPQPWQLSVGALAAGASAEAPLPLATTGPVQRMEPLNNLQVLSHSPGSCRWARWRPAPARRRRSPSPPPGPCSAWSRSTTCRYCPTALAAVGGRAGGRRQRGGAAPPRHHRARAAHGAAQQPAGTVPQPWQLSVGALAAGASAEAPLPLATTGPVQRMEPLNNLQVLSHSPGSCRWARWRPAPARRRRSPSPPPGPCSAWSRSTTCRYCPTALAAVGGRAGGRRQRGGAAPPRHHRARAAHGAAQQPAGTVPQPWQLSVGALAAGASAEAPLPLATTGPVQRMEPLNNLQVAIKNNVDVFYFACLMPAHILFTEDGQLDKRVFLTTWKEIPAANEVQHSLSGVIGTADSIAHKMTLNNVFTIAKRNVEGQDMLYQSLKLTNNIWVLLELKLQPGNPEATLSLKSRTVEVASCIFQAYEAIIKS